FTPHSLFSIHGIAYAMNSVLSKHGFATHNLVSYKRFVGNGQNVLVQKSLPNNKFPDDLLDYFLSEYVLAYNQFWDHNMCVYDGINSLLEYLAYKNIVINVNTNKNEKSTHQILKKYFPAITFTSVIAGDTLSTKKPHPDGAIRIADNAGFKAGECVYIGDSEVDIETARNAGMGCISVAWGFRTQKELIDAGAMCCVKHPDEIKQLI
ncbi:MAG TPA: HAD family hydrolase, partial [Chitinispirillaceae bacterium]|nr:HAD family hydrolase [Chitinispirillaceae bacterium]